MKGFVLMEIGWEYDDENYYRPEGRGGTPQKVFTDPAKAIEEVNRLNEEQGSEDMSPYCEVVPVEIED